MSATYRYMRDPVASYRWMRRNYGDTLTIPTLDGNLVISGEPVGAREVLMASPTTFDIMAPENLRMVFPPRSVPMLIGQEHRRERKIIMPPFHGNRMKAYSPAMQEAALRRAGAWKEGEVFTMQATAKEISLDVILRNVFGVPPQDRERFEEAIMGVVRATTPALLFIGALRHRFGGIGPYARWQRACARVDALIAELIEERRRSPDAGYSDVLAMMMAARYDDGTQMSEESIRDELFALFFAGHAAVGTSTSWAFYWVHRHPQILEQLRDELATLPPDADPQAFAELPYLDAVCSETLRIYPPVPDMFRKVREPLTVRGYELPPGTGVAVFSTMIHWIEDLYPEPEKFRPERFSERKYSSFEFIPFGAGARRCPGAAFSFQLMKIAVGTLLSRYELELVGPEEKPGRQGVGVGPRRGVRMRMVRPLAS